MERGELQGVFVGLGARVAEEEPVVVISRDAAQPVGEFDLQRVLHRVGVEAQPADLLRDGLDVVGLCVADRDDGMTAVEVEVFGTLLVVDEAPLAPHRLDRIE